MGYFEIKHKDNLYAFSRICAGAFFFMLGIMKLFGLWGMPGGPAVFNTMIWYAGVFEIMIGLSLATGVLVRLASAFGIIMMIVAYVLGHAMAMGSWNPLVNFGMPAILYLLFFTVTLAYGAKKFSLEHKVFRKEYF